MKSDVQADEDISLEDLRSLYVRSVEAQWPNLDPEAVQSVTDGLFSMPFQKEAFGFDLHTTEGRLALKRQLDETIETMNTVRAMIAKNKAQTSRQ